MTHNEFHRLVAQDPNLFGTLERAARVALPKQFGVITEAAVVTLMFPVAQYILVHVGLPWLFELKRYSDIHRQKLHEWIDNRYREEGFDPDTAESAGEALCQELESTTTTDSRTAWERIADLMRKES